SSGIMAFAYFTEHQQDGSFPLQNGGLAPALFCWGFLLLVFSGPGSLALAGGRNQSGSRPADPPLPHQPAGRSPPPSRPRPAPVPHLRRAPPRGPGPILPSSSFTPLGARVTYG